VNLMPTYRGWIAGQLQLFTPADHGRSWAAYVTPVVRVANRVTHHAARALTSTNSSTISRVVEYQPPSEPEDWRSLAACRRELGVDPEVFFPPNGARTDLDSPAKEACRSCPVQTDCLEWALETRQRFGIWGGRTRHERRRIARERAIAAGKVSAVTKDEAQDWLRKNATDPFITEQVRKVIERGNAVTGPDDQAAASVMQAIADLMDETDT
jgi:WhiB family redox-sensing transcriptional regulator